MSLADAVPIEVINNRYILVETVGSGTMGTVYRATDRLTREEVALKRVRSIHDEQTTTSSTSDFDFRLTLANEFKVLASLRHPHIISVLDYGFDSNKRPFFVMELLENAENLIDYASTRSFSEQMRLIMQVLQALAYLHRRRIVHRDLKPDNILVVDGQAKVLDFGLAVIRNPLHQEDLEDQLAGTLAYIAPEVLSGSPATERSDLYAIALMAYELLSGSYPFRQDTISNQVDDVLRVQPDIDVLSINEHLQSALKLLLSKNPDDRDTSAQQLIETYAHLTEQEEHYETDLIRESYLQAAEFVGREDELSLLIDAMQQAINGKGSAWLVGGESGVGKSRLLEELRTQAMVSGAVVILGQAIAEGGAPYQPWLGVLRQLLLLTEISHSEASILKRLLPDISTLLERDVMDAPDIDPAAAQDRLFLVIESLFLRQTLPVIILMEDLQWTNESRILLNRLSRFARQLPVLIVGSFRDDEAPHLSLEMTNMRHMKLDRLDLEAVEELSFSMLGHVGRDPGVTRLLQQETEGNVFFIVEAVRALIENAGQMSEVASTTLPPRIFAAGMKTVVNRRLERVPDSDRSLLATAAVAGREIDLALMHMIAPDMPLQPWLTRCAEASVLDVRDDRWRFAHDKLREAILDQLTIEEKQNHHLQVAEAIENVYGENPTLVPLLAHHWREAKVQDKAMEYLDKAGTQAVENFANEDAIDYLQSAQTLDNRPDTDEFLWAKVERQSLLGLAFLGAGEVMDSRHHLLQALELLDYPFPTSRIFRVFQLLGQVIWQAKHRLIGVQHRQESFVHIVLRLYERLSEVLFYTGEIRSASFCALYMLNLAEIYSAVPEMTRGYANLTVVVGLAGRHRVARLYAQLANAHILDIQDRQTRARVRSRLALYLCSVGEWKLAETSAREAMEISLELGNMRQWDESAGILGNLLYMTGRYEEGRLVLQNLHKQSATSADSQYHARSLVWQAQCSIRLGLIEEASELIQNAKKIRGETEIGVEREYASVLALQALVEWRQGSRDTAVLRINELVKVTSQFESSVSFVSLEDYALPLEIYLSLWEDSGSLPPESIHMVESACKRLIRFTKQNPVWNPRALLWHGLLLQLQGKDKTAKTVWERSLTIAQSLGMRYEEACVSYQLARFSPEDDHQRVELLNRAIQLFSELGALDDLKTAQKVQMNLRMNDIDPVAT